MGKQHYLSPEKYITTKARSLPIHKCYVTSIWEDTKMANVFVMRRHVNGNFTAGMYLVDLLCLGVKDTFYFFNVTQEEIDGRMDFDRLYMKEAAYDLAHNIIYAGHDFAMDFDIKPHKDFNITRFILEEDNDDIPLIEIAVGDNDGNPKLMVSPSYNYAPILQKLKQHAGEGNYTFYVGDDFDEDKDDDDVEDDDMDDEEEEFLDFHVVKDMETEELEEIIEEQTRSFSDQIIVNAELLLRQLNETENGVLEDEELVKERRDFKLYETKIEQWQKAYNDSQDAVDNVFPELTALGNNADNLSDSDLMAAFMALLEKHKSEDILSFAIVNSIQLVTILKNLGDLESNFHQYTPAVQLFIVSYAAMQNKELHPNYYFIVNALTVEMAYPFNRSIHAMHHKQFWLVKAIYALQQNDKENILYYHGLLGMSGIGGNIKYLYAGQLENWLKKYMGIADEEQRDGYINFENV